MKSRPRVALLIETSNSYARGLLRGIQAYVRENQHWSTFVPELGRGDDPTDWLKSWRGNGIIARIENERIAETITKLKLPMVDVSAARAVPLIPWVETDDDAIARLAVEHFQERDFKSIAFCGDHRFAWSNSRAEAMRRQLQTSGHTFHDYETDAAHKRGKTPREEAKLEAWLKNLPVPTGILACYDIRARQILELCRNNDLAVPEQLAVLGIDNDELMSELSDPPLSSIMPDTQRTGYLAAQLLDRMMAGEDVPPDAYLVKPLGVATRLSTDVLAIDDAEVASAIRFIREHACDGINVNDVISRVGLTRRILDQRFKKVLGRSPHDEIQRIKLRRVEQLLKETDVSIKDIADKAGFIHTEYLSVLFKEKYGLPPSDFRAQYRR